MPRFEQALPPKAAHKGFSLRRCKDTSAIRGIITCDALTVCDTHYYHGRTGPCERTINDEGRTLDDTRCPACRDKQDWRTHAYVSVFDAKAREHFIFECTDAAAEPLEQYYNANGSLRGCALNAYRPSGKPNGKVTVICQPVDMTGKILPNPPDVAAALCVIWRVPRKGIETQLSANGRITTALTQEGLDKLHKQPDNAGAADYEPPTVGALIDDLTSGRRGNGHSKKPKATA